MVWHPVVQGNGNVGLPAFPALASGAIFIKGIANNGTVVNGTQYVTFGHAFPIGQIASGGGVQANFGSGDQACQMDVMTSYSDSSVCFALITTLAPAVPSGTITWGQFSSGSPASGATLSLSGQLSSTTCTITLTPTALASFPNWTASTNYSPPGNGGIVPPAVTTIFPTAGNAGGYLFQCGSTGNGWGSTYQSGTSEPAWPQSLGGQIADNAVTWTNVGIPFSATKSVNLISVTGTTDFWLQGPLVTCGRITHYISGTQMRVTVDATVYADGTNTFDVTVANDVCTVISTDTQYYGGTQVYTPKITLNGSTAYTGPALIHTLYSDWSWQVGTIPHLTNTSQEMVLQVIHDPNDFITAQCVQSYTTTLGVSKSAVYDGMATILADAHFGYPLYNTQVLVQWAMGQTGGRPDIAPNDAYNTFGFITQDPSFQQVGFEVSKICGSIPWHFWNESLGRYITLSDYPEAGVFGGYGVNYTGGVGIITISANLNNVQVQTTDGQWGLDVSHHPELVYLSCLQTGRRYYFDQLNAVMAWTGLATLDQIFGNNMTQDSRYGAFGLCCQNNQLRCIAWTLRDLGYASYINSDGSYFKIQARQRLDNNCYWFLTQIGYLIALQGECYGWFPNWAYTWLISPWENAYQATSINLLAIMGYEPAIRWSEWSSNFALGMITNGSMSPVSGFPAIEASTYDWAAWPYPIVSWDAGFSGMWPVIWPPAQSWEALEQTHNQSVDAGDGQSSVYDCVFACTMNSSTKATVGTIYAGSLAVGQYFYGGANGAGSSSQWTGTSTKITAISGSVLTLSPATNFYDGPPVYAGTALGNGLHIGPGTMWNANAGSAGSYGDYAQLVAMWLANLQTLGYSSASGALATLNGLTDSTGAAIPALNDTVWANNGALTKIVPRTPNTNQIFNGAAASPATSAPIGYSMPIMAAPLSYQPTFTTVTAHMEFPGEALGPPTNPFTSYAVFPADTRSTSSPWRPASLIGRKTYPRNIRR